MNIQNKPLGFKLGLTFAIVLTLYHLILSLIFGDSEIVINGLGPLGVTAYYMGAFAAFFFGANNITATIIEVITIALIGFILGKFLGLVFVEIKYRYGERSSRINRIIVIGIPICIVLLSWIYYLL